MLESQRIRYFLRGLVARLVLDDEEEEEEEEGEGLRGEAMMVPLKLGQVRWSTPGTMMGAVLEGEEGADEVGEADVGDGGLLVLVGEDPGGDVLVLVGKAEHAAASSASVWFLALCLNPNPSPAPSPTLKPIMMASKTRKTNMDRFRPHIL